MPAKFVKKALQATITKSNILLLFMEKRKKLFAMYAVVPLDPSMNLLSIEKKIIKEDGILAKAVTKSLLVLEVSRNTSRQFMKDKGITNVILVKNPMLH